MEPNAERINTPILETNELCKVFGPTVALDHVSLSIYGGQVTGLIGENGSGKSTVASIIAGMQPPTSGTMPLSPASIMVAG